MKKAIFLHDVSPAKRLAFAAVFAALCFVGTLIAPIPAPAGGFLNVGDVFVLLTGWCLGPVYGAIAAGIGSALADVTLTYVIYAPATFLIKGVNAAVAYFIWYLLKKLVKKEPMDFLPRAVAALVCETIMVGGYFLYDSLLGGVGQGVANAPLNFFQALIGFVGSVALVSAIYPIKAVRKFFPLLGSEVRE